MKQKNNIEVRGWIIGHGLTYKEVAREIPISQAGFSAMLQKELSKGMKREIINAAKKAMLRKEQGEIFNGTHETQKEPDGLLP